MFIVYLLTNKYLLDIQFMTALLKVTFTITSKVCFFVSYNTLNSCDCVASIHLNISKAGFQTSHVVCISAFSLLQVIMQEALYLVVISLHFSRWNFSVLFFSLHSLQERYTPGCLNCLPSQSLFNFVFSP